MTIKASCLALLFSLLAAALHASTATLTPDSNYLLPGGGTVTFTANLAGHPGTTTAVGWTVAIPSGWAYVSGTNEPGVKPATGTTGTLEWAYVTIPNRASFTFTVSYPSSIGTDRNVTSSVIVRAGGTPETVTPAAVTLSPATAPAITSAAATSATFGSTLSFAITATSPIPITTYAASGLPAGLSINATSGLISGAPTQSGVFAATLSATNAAGTGSATLTLTVTPANGSILLSGLSHTYNAAGASATVETTPAGLGVIVTYDGNTTAPVNAGSYAVVATTSDPNYTATASGTLVIAPAAQTIDFRSAGIVQPGQSVTLSATASSGQPVTFTVLSGSATVTGNLLSVSGAGDVVVRASQAGNANYLAASADQTINSAKLAQTIDFSAPAGKRATDAAFALAATATSRLPVTFTVLSGPAILDGSTVTLTGAAGTVVIRASQAGNDNYNAAPDVTRSLAVEAEHDRVFFGSVQRTQSKAQVAPDGERRLFATAAIGELAAVLPANSNQGWLLIVAPEVGLDALVAFTVADDGQFTSQVTQHSTSAVTSPATVTVRGRLAGALLSGTIDPLGLGFGTVIESATGPTAAIAGLYRSDALNSESGGTYTIVGSSSNALVLAVTPAVIAGGTATVGSDGAFELQVQAASGEGSVAIRGAVDSAKATVYGQIIVPGEAPTEFAGLHAGTVRTDRLVNLSSRARVGAGERLLITGFVIGGSQPKPVLIRAVGPGLTPLGVQTALANPRIQIFHGATPIAANDDWSSGNATTLAATAARIGAFAITPGSTDAALLVTLPPGAYTAQITGGDGVALAEVYDASENPKGEYQRLVNISSRGEVGSAEAILIGGFVVTGNSPKRVLVRGVGPALAAQGIANPLGDPVLTVFRRSEVIARNDDWSADAEAAALTASAATTTGAFALAAGSKDAAAVLTLAPGLYTVQVTGKGGSTGIALVEIYEIP